MVASEPAMHPVTPGTAAERMIVARAAAVRLSAFMLR